MTLNLVITKYWLYSFCCIIHSCSLYYTSSLHLPLPHFILPHTLSPLVTTSCSLYSSVFLFSNLFTQFSHSVISDSSWPHGLQHARFPCPSPTPGACSNSCPSSQWCNPTVSSSVIPFSRSLQSFTASGSFPMSQFFTWSGQSIGASASVLPMHI